MELALVVGVCAVAGCAVEETFDVSGEQFALVSAEKANRVRELAWAAGVAPNWQLPAGLNRDLVELGRNLAFDKILSGNQDISCMTCHHPTLGTGDGLRLAVGQGGTGLGPRRTHPQNQFIPRNAPALFNIKDFRRMFFDSRVELDGTSLITPAGAELTPKMKGTLVYGLAAVQALFPVLSFAEMLGAGNDIAAAVDAAPPGAKNTAGWNAYMKRLGSSVNPSGPSYRQLFETAYPGTPFGEMTFAHVANAIAAFEIASFTLGDSPFDAFLAGDNQAISETAVDGALKFFGPANCSTCHNGPHFTDLQHHNTALPQYGPGKGHGTSGTDDFGRGGVTGAAGEKYAFRTPSLRNVELTGPWGHAGQFVTLAGFVNHYNDPEGSLLFFDPESLPVALIPTYQYTATEILATIDPKVTNITLDGVAVSQLTEFLKTLTSTTARDLSFTIPLKVASGLPVVD